MGAPDESMARDAACRRPSRVGLVATGVLLLLLGAASFEGVRRALTIGLPLDLVCAAVSVGLLAWVGTDALRRRARRRRGGAERPRRWFTLRPAVCAAVLLLPLTAWYALRIPGPMGAGPVAVAFDPAPWTKGPWRTGPVVAVSLGDSVVVGYGAPPGLGYFDLVLRNDVARHPDVGRADLASVLPDLRPLRLGTLSSSSLDHERTVASLPRQADDVFGLVFLSTGGIDLIHPYGHGTPREGAMYGATLAQARPWIVAFRARLERMLVALESRFPGGCEIFVATIYDPTDGVGDLEHAGVAFWLPRWPDGLAIHAEFNRAIRDACARHPFAHVVEVHRTLLGHGIHCRDASNPHHDRSDPTYWYYWNLEDPNERGYDAIRRTFLGALGGVLPPRFAALGSGATERPR